MSLKATGMSLFMLSFIPPPQATATKRHHRHLRFKPLGCWRTGIFHCRSLTVLISINQAGYPYFPSPISFRHWFNRHFKSLPPKQRGGALFNSCLGCSRDIGSLLGSTKNAPLFRRKRHSLVGKVSGYRPKTIGDRDESVSQLD